MARIEIDHQGTKRYYDDNDTLHRDDGPAVIYQDRYNTSTAEWYVNGKWERRRHHRSGSVIMLITSHNTTMSLVGNPNGHKEWFNKVGNVWPELK